MIVSSAIRRELCDERWLLGKEYTTDSVNKTHLVRISDTFRNAQSSDGRGNDFEANNVAHHFITIPSIAGSSVSVHSRNSVSEPINLLQPTNQSYSNKPLLPPLVSGHSKNRKQKPFEASTRFMCPFFFWGARVNEPDKRENKNIEILKYRMKLDGRQSVLSTLSERGRPISWAPPRIMEKYKNKIQ